MPKVPEKATETIYMTRVKHVGPMPEGIGDALAKKAYDLAMAQGTRVIDSDPVVGSFQSLPVKEG